MQLAGKRDALIDSRSAECKSGASNPVRCDSVWTSLDQWQGTNDRELPG
jgi:hypothetical protein